MYRDKQINPRPVEIENALINENTLKFSLIMKLFIF
jgi:hypothetical protein